MQYLQNGIFQGNRRMIIVLLLLCIYNSEIDRNLHCNQYFTFLCWSLHFRITLAVTVFAHWQPPKPNFHDNYFLLSSVSWLHTVMSPPTSHTCLFQCVKRGSWPYTRKKLWATHVYTYSGKKMNGFEITDWSKTCALWRLAHPRQNASVRRPFVRAVTLTSAVTQVWSKTMLSPRSHLQKFTLLAKNFSPECRIVIMSI